MKVYTPKTILILGNGFDLAHGLPTRYSDFLEFAKRVMYIYINLSDTTEEDFYKDNIVSWGINEPADTAKDFLKEKLVGFFKKRQARDIPSPDNPNTYVPDVHVDERIDLFYGYLKDNIWYKYILSLYNDKKVRGENWIDFEHEISFIIESIDNTHISLSQSLYDVINSIKSEKKANILQGKIELFFSTCIKCLQGKPYEMVRKTNIRDLRAKIYNNLERLILAFEIYLTDFVEDMPVLKKISAIETIKPDYVISFNYTNTYEKYYLKAGEQTKICYIHGVCDKNRKPENNNMVLGIDEYLPEEKRTEQVDFCIFKKFVQRIRKHNDVSYATWCEEVENARIRLSYGDVSNIYIFGHSLDVTDKDILKRFLICNKTRIHIFARDKSSEGELIANLLRIADEDIIISKSTASPLMIEFLAIE